MDDFLRILRAMVALEALNDLQKRGPLPAPDLTPQTPCSPEGRSPYGRHKHVCEGCGTAWEHDDRMPMLCSEDQNRQAHTCPECGREQWFKHLPSIL